MSDDSLPAVAFIGAGSMGGAIFAGLYDSGLADDIRVSMRTPEKVAEFAAKPGVSGFDARSASGSANAVAGARLVVLGVKPNATRAVLAELAPALEPSTVLVSIAAGITTDVLESLVPDQVRVVRTMPNLPSQVRLGVTAVVGGTRATDDDIALVSRLFETVGEVVPVAEDQMDAVTSVTGSGPGYIFYLAEQFIEAARRRGFSDEQASTLVTSTMRGAVEQLALSDQSAGELRRRVTSPNGTTEAGLAVLAEANLADVFDRTTAAAQRRAGEIAAES